MSPRSFLGLLRKSSAPDPVPPPPSAFTLFTPTANQVTPTRQSAAKRLLAKVKSVFVSKDQADASTLENEAPFFVRSMYSLLGAILI